MNIKKENFGQVDEKTVFLYTIRNSKGSTIRIINYGCIVTAISVPDKVGEFRDIVLGFDNLDDYIKENPYFGAAVGRVGNRIQGGRFELNGSSYKLACNEGKNHLHGGINGFNKVVWDSEIRNDSLYFTYTSPDGEEGYPGNLNVTIIYSFTDDDEFKIGYKAVCDKDSPVDLTHHSYFNLDGEGKPTILDHLLTINADHFLPILSDGIPTGEVLPVGGTPLDFKDEHSVGERISDDADQLIMPGGYDHYYILNPSADETEWAVRVESKSSGIKMEVYTTEPGLQFYSGNKLDGSLRGKSGIYNHRSGFCFETQKYPDSVHFPEFPNTVLKKGEIYSSGTIYKFMS